MIDIIDVSLIVTTLISVFSALAYAFINNYKSTKKASIEKDNKVYSILEKQVEHLQRENAELRQQVSLLQQQLLDLYKQLNLPKKEV